MNDSEKSIYLVSVGARTPVGTTALETALMTRSGVSRLQLHPFMIDLTGEAIQVGKANYLPDELSGKQRCSGNHRSAKSLEAHSIWKSRGLFGRRSGQLD